MRVARSRELLACGFAGAAVARVMQIGRRALCRVPTPRTRPQRRPPADPVEALAHQTYGYRMVAAFVRCKHGIIAKADIYARVLARCRWVGLPWLDTGTHRDKGRP
jgi:hypothetical protein